MAFSPKTASRKILRVLFMATLLLLIDKVGARSLSAGTTASSSGPRLVGTVEGAPFSGAVFDDGTGVQTFYRLHEQLPDGSHIVKVQNDSIMVKKTDGSLYEIFTTGTANSAATALPATGVTLAEPRASPPNVGTTPLRPRGRFGRAPEPDE